MNGNDKKQIYLEKQLQAYEREVAMTGKERKALREWVRSGHSVCESPGSRYLCDMGMPEQDFLDVYRQDQRIKKELAGKTGKEKEAWLKEYMGYEEAAREDPQTTEQLKEQLRKLERELFHVWGYISQEGLWNEAREYVEEHADEAVPFEML